MCLKKSFTHIYSQMRNESMTDPLTGKQLVEKSYEYIDRLTRECAKTILEDYNKAHRKFSPDSVGTDTSADIARWFEKRDKFVHVAFEPASVMRPQPNQYHSRFRGNTKDADFELCALVSAFVVPGSEYSGQPISFVKSIQITADKTKFTRRKV